MTQRVPTIKYIRNKEILTALTTAKQNAGEGATNWWKSVIFMDFNGIETKKFDLGECKYVKIYYIDENNKRHSPIIRVYGEICSGQIVPRTEEEFRKYQERNTKYGGTKTIRDGKTKPTISIKKYKASLKGLVEEDKTIEYPEDKLSDYYQLVELFNETFKGEINSRIKEGRRFITFFDDNRQKHKTIQSLIDAYSAANSTTIVNCSMIFSTDQLSDINSAYKNVYPQFLSKQIINSSVKIADMCQRTVKGGGELVNPMTRVNFYFDKSTSKSGKFRFLDAANSYEIGGKVKYNELKINGNEVDDFNIDIAIRPGSVITSADIDISQICFSSMGISIPAKFKNQIYIDKAISGDFDEEDADEMSAEVSSFKAGVDLRSSSTKQLIDASNTQSNIDDQDDLDNQ